MSSVPADPVPPPPLTPAGFQVLLAIAAGHAHGYAVMGYVDRLTGGTVRLGPGTLYRTIARLVADGLVTETGRGAEGGVDPAAPHDARRRYYALTPRGRAVAETEARLLARLADAAAETGLLPDRRSS